MSIIYKNGTYYGGGGGAEAEITIDSELSSISENPIQNKVIKTELDNKVDKVAGKGLSTNDYTNEEKEKLSEISSDTGVISGSYGPESKDVLYHNTVFPVPEITVNSKGKVTSIKERDITAINNHSYYLSTNTPGSTAMKVLTVRDEKRGNVENTVNDFQGMIIGVLTTSEDNTANNVELSFDGGFNSFSIKYNGAVYTGNDPKITGWKNHYIYYMFDGYNFIYMGNDTNEPYTTGDGIKIEDDEISVDKMSAEDMAEVASPMPSVMSRRFKYSTEEQIVGEWIDGKPLYQKTISGTTGTAGSFKTIAHNISNISEITFINGVVQESSTEWHGAGCADALNQSIRFDASTTNVSVYVGHTALSNKSVNITIQYTKTTD